MQEAKLVDISEKKRECPKMKGDENTVITIISDIL
jgi:hypothetical protein